MRVWTVIKRISISKWNNNIRNYARLIPNDKIVTLDNSTLTGRLIFYLKSKPETTELTQQTDNFNANELLNLLKHKNLAQINISNEKLLSFISYLEDKNLIKSNKEFYKILLFVDEECCSRHENLKTKEIMDFLDVYLKIIPNRVTQLKFYRKAMDTLFSKRENLRGKDYMKFLFYIALMKKNLKSQKLLRKTLLLLDNEDIEKLSTEELCIIANSAFKTSTKISNKNILNKIKCYLNDNLIILRDPAVFVTLIKCLRQNRFCDEDLLATISCALFFNKAFEFYTFQTYCHLLALYSDNLYYDEKLMEYISNKCIANIKDYSSCNSGHKKIRGKDLVTFLWGMGNLNCTFISNDLDIIVSTVLQFIESSQLDLHDVIDIFWYLWMLNHKCYRLVPYLLDKRYLLDQLLEKNSTRQRLNQLLVCIYHEDRYLFNKLCLKPHGKTDFIASQHLKNRPCLHNVLMALNSIGRRRKMKFELNYQIPHMNILGITGYEKNIYKSVHVEVLDHFTTLNNSYWRPTGLMQTKLRILGGSEEGLIVLKESEIDDRTQSQLEQFLEEELNLVC